MGPPSPATGPSPEPDSCVELAPDEGQRATASREAGPPPGREAALAKLQGLIPHFEGYTVTTELGRAEAAVREVLAEVLAEVRSHTQSVQRLLETACDWEGREEVGRLLVEVETTLIELKRPPPEMGAVPPDTEVSPAQQEALYEWELTLTDRLASCRRHTTALLELADSGGAGALKVELQACREALDYFGHDWRRRQEQFAGLAMGP